MSTKTRLYAQDELAAALAQEDPEMPLPGLVDLRHKEHTLAKTQVLDDAELRKLRHQYEAMRGPQQPLASESRPSEITDVSVRAVEPRRVRRLIGVLLAVAIGMVSWSVCRSWMAGQHVARAATQAVPALPSAPVAEATTTPLREVDTQPAAANLPRTALDALASGDRERARRAYEELARKEVEPGPYSTAAEILARELKAAR